MKRWLKRGLLAMIVLAFIGIGAVVGVVYHFSKNLPDNTALREYVPPITTRLHASNGDLMAEYAEEYRVFLPITEMPDLVKRAFLSAEDQNFYSHGGIDLFALARAV